MIKKFEYHCDGGCIVLGNTTCTVNLPNGIGDGAYTVEIRDIAEIATQYEATANMKWIGVVEGDDINIYRYDCLTNSGLGDKRNILYTLSKGRWDIYRASGYITLQQKD